MPEAQAARDVVQQAAWLGIRMEGWLTIAALLLGPILALTIQRLLDHIREKQKRKIAIFRSLMATRGYTISPQHVGSLNEIDVEFYSAWPQSNKRVTTAWKALRNHLYDTTTFAGDAAAWNRRSAELRVDLLHEMGEAVGYPFDKDDIARNVYVPGAHGETEAEWNVIRKALAKVFQSKQHAIPIQVVDGTYEAPPVIGPADFGVVAPQNSPAAPAHSPGGK